MFEILREPGIDRWTEKAEWIMRHHGLITMNVHPDYVVEQRYLDRYEAFLAYLAGLDDVWHALPRDAARWWREREGLRIGDDGRVAGRTGFCASVAYACERDGRLAIEL